MEKPASNRNQVSPEYKARCIEWALRINPERGADKLIADARKLYDYVYEERS